MIFGPFLPISSFTVFPDFLESDLFQVCLFWLGGFLGVVLVLNLVFG